MSLWAYALRTVANVKTLAWPSAGSNVDSLIEACTNEASQMVEKAWGRDIVSRGALTEYHPRLDPSGRTAGLYVPPISGPSLGVTSGPLCLPLGPECFLNEHPIVSVTSVKENGVLLVVDTDYKVSKPTGKVIRLSGGTPRAWLSTWRANEFVYTGGYKDTAGNPSAAEDVPPAILRVFDELVGWMIRQRASKEVGLTVATDAIGTRTYSGPAYITDRMQEALNEAGASPGSLVRTGERDA